MRGSTPNLSVLTALFLLVLASGPLFNLQVPVHSGSKSVEVQYADSLTMPLPTVPLPMSTGSALAPVSGVLRVLVIAAEFSDVNHTVSTDQIRQEYFGNGNGTVASYYREISYGTVTIQGDVVGWVRLDHPMVYYGRDCTTIDDADCGGSPTSWWIARDAVHLVNVTFNNYDYFVFVHSGPGEETTKDKNTVWSVTYLSGIYVQTSGKTLSKFNIVPEIESSGAVPLGVYCHEFGHQLGLPDLYNTQTGRTIMGPWALMDKGLWNGQPPGSSPTHMEAWSKIQLGWISGTSLAVAGDGAISNYTVAPIEVTSSGVHAIKIPIASRQYYLVEVRQHIGFDQPLPSTGVLITFVDESLYVGKVKIIDGHPNVPGLANATWSVGQVFTDEKNNLAVGITANLGNSFQITVNTLGPMADLAVAKISTQPSQVSPNTTVTVLIDIVNIGTVTASNVDVQISLDGQPFASKPVTVGPNATTEVSLSWIAVAGTHLFRVVIDPNNLLPEWSKLNNVATYTLNVGPTLIITVPLDVVTANATTWVIVNGVKYDTNQTVLRLTVPPGPVTVELPPTVSTSTGTRQAFTGWSDGNQQNPRQITVSSDTSLKAAYKTQYLLTIDQNGGNTSPGGWFDSNTTITVSASPSNVTEQVSRMLFTNWSGDMNSNSTSLSLKIIKPVTLKANWKLQYYLNIVSSVGSPSGSGWYDGGASAIISVQPSVQLKNDTRQIFTGWSGGASGQNQTAIVVVNSPMVVQVSWKLQYLVQIQSQYGKPQGSGWHDAGTQLPVTIEPSVDYGNRTRRIFTSWGGDYSGTNPSFTLAVNGPKTLKPNWATQYELSFGVTGLQNSTYVKLNINNAYHELSPSQVYQDWFTQGAQINPTVNQTVVNGFLQFQLMGFQNSTGQSVAPPFTVNGPMDYTVVYQQAFPLLAIPGFPIESILIGLMMAVLVLGLFRRRKDKSN